MTPVSPVAVPDKEALELLKATHMLREFHHKALWEEERHFTWLNSIVFSAQLLLLTNSSISADAKLIPLHAVTAVGVLFSLIALRVLRAESLNFHDTLASFNHARRLALVRRSPHPFDPTRYRRAL